MIVCAHSNALIKNEKNEIYVCGSNRRGQLGLGDNIDRNIFEKVEYDFGKIKNIACHFLHVIIQNEKNEIYACGSNRDGRLGLGDKKDRDKYEKVDYDLGEIKNMASGNHHTMIQNEKNDIYVCGYNQFGQLGLGDEEDRDKYEKVEYNFGEIKKILCGNNYTIIQNEKNEIYVCGKNWNGQLGLGDKKNRDNFEKVEYEFGEIKNIACGENHIVIQNDKNEIYVCGNNLDGQLGLCDNIDRNKFKKVKYDFGKIKNIACGVDSTIIQNEKNEIYVCGRNHRGQLGLGDNIDRNKFEKIEYDFGQIKNIICCGYHMIIQNEKNEIYVCDGKFGLGDNNDRDKFEKVKQNWGEIKNMVYSGCNIMVQNIKNEIYVCGSNTFGQLGLGDYEIRNKFEKVNTDDIFEKIYDFELKLNTEEIAL